MTRLKSAIATVVPRQQNATRRARAVLPSPIAFPTSTEAAMNVPDAFAQHTPDNWNTMPNAASSSGVPKPEQMLLISSDTHSLSIIPIDGMARLNSGPQFRYAPSSQPPQVSLYFFVTTR
ncbi:hypothetical protein DQ04_19041000 [Trypanosoma grayi]|uniref:hypothetical protein n=1 Tax=Trypanosoma grayi TaxID=71804 RepID=UPI0004F456A5|nr:hypothetical protein DQ04_19041000 [Trypanosoma grayi]KEG05714.1 hypothetical protein DQ04_19041000 [Trypanosoma grayi]